MVLTAVSNYAEISGIDITPTQATVNYPSPFPAWKNALAWTTPINAAKAVLHYKSYDAQATNFYMTWAPNGVYYSGGIAGWNGADDIVHANNGSSSGGFYSASLSDPTYQYDYDGSDAGYGGAYSTGISNVHIPNGARTQNSGAGNCDCHLWLLEPVGWVPISTNGTVWPDVSPAQYELDLENAANAHSCYIDPATGQLTGASEHAGSNGSCTTFTGGTAAGEALKADSGVVFSTGSTGWYGGTTTINNGFSPGSNPPTKTAGPWPSAGNKGGTPFTAQTITAADILQGAINHEIGLNMICLQPANGPTWPSSNTGSDLPCMETAVHF